MNAGGQRRNPRVDESLCLESLLLPVVSSKNSSIEHSDTSTILPSTSFTSIIGPPPSSPREIEDESIQPKPPIRRYPPPDPGLRIRHICIFGLAAGWAFSIACLVLGLLLVISNHNMVPEKLQGMIILVNFLQINIAPASIDLASHRIFPFPAGTSMALKLVINLLATIIVDTTNYIHAVSLKWALLGERRLEFNSTIRLITCTRSHGPNSWYMNAISLVALALTYGAVSCVVTDVTTIGHWDPQAKEFITHPMRQTLDYISVNGAVLIALGIGIFVQVCISTYCLLYDGRRSAVRTWSRNTLTNAQLWAKAMEDDDDDASLAVVEVSVQNEQASMLEIAPQVRLLRHLIWGVCLFLSLWSLAQGMATATAGHSMKDTVDSLPRPLHHWRFYGAYSWAFSDQSDPYWLGLIIQTVCQSFITFALHCVELLFNLSRDEAAWRQTESIGAEIDQSFWSTLNWQIFLLVIAKATVHWVFGYAISADLTFNISLLPAITLAGMFALLALFVEYMVKKRPLGSLPATYGCFARLAELVDDWDHPRLFWGDRGAFDAHRRRAGTAGRRLADLQPGSDYIIVKHTDDLQHNDLQHNNLQRDNLQHDNLQHDNLQHESITA
ncbi:hypothetical protein ASPZODRAFT_20506 [Penicilliopsis zonata CBS 506.65]|uniref:Uncharacterized protein n=1 Tax=Penicilliopsis zonata CBS 506.65 TaxID=1073090 RepID=A0A1L9S5E9_9EURO|nr:hypothetical protein ASPZODRAFT_20506 [Penicilliopsis zonata CBS 506.65]OJJ42388.1 hypothetical protein ASPZODRAFT_20506 [Penicilliopsis zonata CBS 506.65]